ncbi:MAG: FtsX-like permease family protein, partial [Bacteroidota bacterium]
IEGTNFDGTSKDEFSIIINEEMVKALRMDNPIGTELIDMFDYKRRVIGVVKNFHYQSLFEELSPLAFVRGPGNSIISIKVNVSNMEEAMSSISTVWSKTQPNQVIRYQFMDQRFEQMYDILNRAKVIFLIFCVLSLVIACSGLFALSVFLIGQRSKEISVRKVLGAKVRGLFWLLSVDFLKLVGISILIAIPIGWYLMDSFLEEFVNRVDIGWMVFFLASFATVVITIFTTIHFSAVGKGSPMPL